MKIRIVGAGLAGSECALQLARLGHRVTLHEMRPLRTTEAHQTDRLGELVCSNSFRSSSPLNAVGLLKAEMTLLGSVIMECGERARIPAGDAFAVDRGKFADTLTGMVDDEPLIELVRGEVHDLEIGDADHLVIATGPLTSSDLYDAIGRRLGADNLYFYDAIAPIVAADSLDMSKLYWKSRYDKGDGADYLNSPLTKSEYGSFLAALGEADLHAIHDFDNAAHFEGCLPIEEMAARGVETLRYGPMKPVGLENPATGERPWAVVQLRREDFSDEYFNLVGFQTKMKIPSQQKVLRMLPGLENAVFARWGSMHRNTFINGPRHLDSTFRLKSEPRIWFAGQITGVEGYVESAATGLLVARYLDAVGNGEAPKPCPDHTALGALGRHVSESSPDRYQPSNINWALIRNISDIRRKRDRRADQARLALQTVRELAERSLDAVTG